MKIQNIYGFMVRQEASGRIENAQFGAQQGLCGPFIAEYPRGTGRVGIVKERAKGETIAYDCLGRQKAQEKTSVLIHAALLFQPRRAYYQNKWGTCRFES